MVKQEPSVVPDGAEVLPDLLLSGALTQSTVAFSGLLMLDP